MVKVGLVHSAVFIAVGLARLSVFVTVGLVVRLVVSTTLDLLGWVGSVVICNSPVGRVVGMKIPVVEGFKFGAIGVSADAVPAVLQVYC